MKSMRLCATSILIVSALTAVSLRLAAQSVPNPTATPAAPAAQSAVAPANSAPTPIIEVEEPTFNFGKAPVGEKVRHTYKVTNKGTATLEISDVHPSCGCTTVGDWSRKIEPGQSGQISIQFDTSRYGGGPPVTKSISVTSNAKNSPRLTLLLQGSVWKPIEVTPSIAVISIPPDATDERSSSVKIVNGTENPVTFSNPKSANKLFTAELKELKAGFEYELVITAKPPYNPGNSPGTVTVTTSLPGMATISVPVTASVPQPVQVFPSQVMFSGSPDRWTTNQVTIRGSTSDVLVLSNAKASDSRIYVEVQPRGPKGMYNLVVAFPPGYGIAPGQAAEVTIQSNHPKMPLIRIPVREYPHPRMMAQRNLFTNGPVINRVVPPAPPHQ